MKKISLFILSICLVSGIMAQETTVNVAFLKVKLTERQAMYKGMAEHNAKYRPAGSPFAIAAYNITGGVHNGEVLVLSNIGKSFTDRDNAPKPTEEQTADLYNKVYSHLESVNDGDVMVYSKNYSSGAFNERSDKIYNTIYYLKFSAGDDFWGLFKKLKAVWTKLNMNVAVYIPITGASRVVLSQRLPKGWSELDQNVKFDEMYEQLNGKGSLTKDFNLFASYVERKESMMMTLNKDISSK